MKIKMKDEFVSKETCNAKYDDVKSDITDIKEDIKLIKNNHLFHIENDISYIKIEFAKLLVSSNLKNKVIWLVSGSIISVIVGFVLKSVGVF